MSNFIKVIDFRLSNIESNNLSLLWDSHIQITEIKYEIVVARGGDVGVGARNRKGYDENKSDDEQSPEELIKIVDEEKEKWDCETILSKNILILYYLSDLHSLPVFSVDVHQWLQ